MHLKEHINEALRNLYFSKLRSVLALLGVLVGTASVVAMVSGGELATHEALQAFKSLGTDLLALSINSSHEETRSGDGKTEQLNLQQVYDLLKADAALLQVAPYTQIFNPISYQGLPINGMVLGVTQSFADIVHVQLQSGRFISTADKYQFFCVIGDDIYQAMKQISAVEPLGQHIQIGKIIFVIVGVAHTWPENSFVYANIDNSIMVPLLASTIMSKYASINNMIFRLSPDAAIPQVEAHLTQTMDEMLAGKQINFRSAKELIAKMKQQSEILTIFLGLIGSISLFVGGIGVMNIMLVSVVERRREIGIRLAVGAKRRDIGLLFLTEAILLSLLGGIMGVVIGLLIAYLIALFCQWEFIFFIYPPLAGFTVSVAVGMFFGFYPAFLASKLDPIDALRAE